jgi:micrococcal nuclease
MSQRRAFRLAVLLTAAVLAHFYFGRAGGSGVRAPAPSDELARVERRLDFPRESGQERAREPTAARAAAARIGPCDVTHVTDGDTLNVRCGGRKERVRMLQIDTPERDDPLYEEAGDALAALIAGRRVELEVGREPRDDYGRVLAYVFAGGENLNLAMIRDGWSPYFDRYGAGAYPREFAEAERAAREAKLGIWGPRR